MGDCTLATSYPFLFELCSNPDITLPEVIDSQGRSVTFFRTLTGVVKYEWQDLLQILNTFTAAAPQDHITWALESNGKFSVNSLYQFLSFGGVQEIHAMEWWSLPIPPKIKVFMWLLSKNKILTKDNLAHKGWLGNIKCQFCSADETVDHLFLTCTKSRQVLFWLGDLPNFLPDWHTFQDLLDFGFALPLHLKTCFLITLGAFAWVIWNSRNTICFQHTPIPTVRSLVSNIVQLVSYWTGTLTEMEPQMRNAWLPATLDDIPLQEWDPETAGQLIDLDSEDATAR